MRLAFAQKLAEKIVETMRPHCERVEVAGSIRRCKPQVKDIEIVAIPKLGEFTDLLQEHRHNLLHDWARQVDTTDKVHWIKAGQNWNERKMVNPDGRYWRGLMVEASLKLQEPIKLDLFLTTTETWGCTFLIRTGPADYSTRIVSNARPNYYFADGKMFDRHGQVVLTPEENDVYLALGLPFLRPEQRF